MSALIIAIYLWLGGLFGVDASNNIQIIEEYKIEATQYNNTSQNSGEYDMVGA